MFEREGGSFFFQRSTDLLLLKGDCSMAKGDELLNKVKAKRLTGWMLMGRGEREESGREGVCEWIWGM
jgi:hypothetical protein